MLQNCLLSKVWVASSDFVLINYSVFTSSVGRFYGWQCTVCMVQILMYKENVSRIMALAVDAF